MPMTWRVGNKVRLRAGSKERTYTVQKIIVVKPGGFVRRGEHLYLIKDTKNGQMQRVRAEALTHA